MYYFCFRKNKPNSLRRQCAALAKEVEKLRKKKDEDDDDGPPAPKPSTGASSLFNFGFMKK